jgi:dTMP kinase
MARSGARVEPAEELRWFVEDRREHVARVLRPGLEADAIVLTDRYFLSTVAYQGARGLDPARLLADAEAEFPLPDLAIVLEIEPAAGLGRVAGRGGIAEPAFEDEPYLGRVAAIFRGLDRPYVERIAAHPAPEVLARSIWERVALRL